MATRGLHRVRTNLIVSSDIKYFQFVPHNEMMDILSGSFITINSSESEVSDFIAL